MASIIKAFIDKQKKKSGRSREETFSIRNVWGRFEEEGFRPLIKADVLEKRLKDLKDTFLTVAEKLAGATTDDERRQAIDLAHYLVFYAHIAWLRTIDNKGLHKAVNDFIEQYSFLRNIPSALHILLDETKSIIALFSNIDVEPLRPIMMQTAGKRIALTKEGLETY